ncbi:MAG: hypothetical protein E6H58_09750, partial [Betaproteobacteria bacterium]
MVDGDDVFDDPEAGQEHANRRHRKQQKEVQRSGVRVLPAAIGNQQRSDGRVGPELGNQKRGQRQRDPQVASHREVALRHELREQRLRQREHDRRENHHDDQGFEVKRHELIRQGLTPGKLPHSPCHEWRGPCSRCWSALRGGSARARNFTTPGHALLTDRGLKQRFLRAAGWTLVGHGLAQVIRLASNLVLTRLLAPELYGVMSVGYVVITGLWMFSDLGLSSGAIQNRRGDDPLFLNVSWVVQIGRGVVITLAALLFALGVGWVQSAGWMPARSVYADPQVPMLIVVVSAYGIISGFESTRTTWARRKLSLGRLTQIDLACQIATTIFQLIWAVIAPSLWTLAGGWLFGAALKAVLTHTVLPGPPNRIEWDRTAFREVFDFGKWVFLSS